MGGGGGGGGGVEEREQRAGKLYNLLKCQSWSHVHLPAGYRAAQCGWALVYDSPASDNERKKSSKSSKRRGSGSSGSGGDGPSCDVEGLRARKKAQCLCIYAPRRGILEVS